MHPLATLKYVGRKRGGGQWRHGVQRQGLRDERRRGYLLLWNNGDWRRQQGANCHCGRVCIGQAAWAHVWLAGQVLVPVNTLSCGVVSGGM